MVISAAINRYMFISLNKSFGDDYQLKYSQLERAKTIDEIEHPIIREALSRHYLAAGYRNRQRRRYPFGNRSRYLRFVHRRPLARAYDVAS